MFAQLAEPPKAFDDAPGFGGDGLEVFAVRGGEGASLKGFAIDNAEEEVAVLDGNGEFGLDVGMDGQVAVIEANFVDEKGAAVGGNPAGDAAKEGDRVDGAVGKRTEPDLFLKATGIGIDEVDTDKIAREECFYLACDLRECGGGIFGLRSQSADRKQGFGEGWRMG